MHPLLTSSKYAPWLKIARACFFGIALLFSANGFAQINPEIANCEELKDSATIEQMEFCTTHVGCNMVMKFHSTCAKAKQFINRIKESMSPTPTGDTPKDDMAVEKKSFFDRVGSGFKDLLGSRKELTSNQVFEASLSDNAKKAESADPDWKARTAAIRNDIDKAGTSVKTGKTGSGGDWVFIGQNKEGSTPNGMGTFYSSDGQIQRGEFKDGKMNGQVDFVNTGSGNRTTNEWSQGKREGEGFSMKPDGSVYKGGYANDQANGRGTYIFANGTRYEGGFANGEYSGQGALYRADGSLWQRGLYAKNELEIGQNFDTAGKVTSEVNKPAALLAAAEGRQKIENERIQKETAERQAAEQRRRAEVAAREKAYQDSLQTMNAGQLFALADELSSKGDSAKAREVLRTLVSRFPDHALAANAAQQMANMNAGNAGGSGNTNATPNKTNSNNPAGAVGGATQMACNESIDVYLNALPRFQANGLQGIVNALRTQGQRHIADVRTGRTTTAHISGYQQEMEGYKQSGRQALENHKSLSGPPSRAMCNPPENSQAFAWAATQMGVGFNTWAINTIRCAAGQNPLPIPAFCPY